MVVTRLACCTRSFDRDIGQIQRDHGKSRLAVRLPWGPVVLFCSTAVLCEASIGSQWGKAWEKEAEKGCQGDPRGKHLLKEPAVCMSNFSFLSQDECNSLHISTCLKAGFLKEKQDHSSIWGNLEDCNGALGIPLVSLGHLSGCAADIRPGKRKGGKGRRRQTGGTRL